MNGYFKDKSTRDECETICLQEPLCSGFAVSTDKHHNPNRCYIHGNISSSDIFSGWEYVQSQHFVPGTTSGEFDSSCWRRPKGKIIIAPTLFNCHYLS